MGVADDILNNTYSKKKKQSVAEQILNGTYVSPIEKQRIRKKEEEEKKRSWFESGAFSDGYQFGDISRTILGTANDVTQDVVAGIVEIPEKVIDAGAYAVGGVGNLFGADDFADDMKKFIAKDILDSNKIATAGVNVSPAGMINNLISGDIPFKNYTDDTNIESNSLLGEKSDSLMESAGQLAATVGLQAVGVPWQVTTGVTSFGAETENAFNNDATYGEAGLSATISTAAELLTETLFKIPGIKATGSGKFGEKIISKLSEKFGDTIGRNFLNWGISSLGEGGEEVITSFVQRLGQSLTYEKESTVKELIENEDLRNEYFNQVAEKLFSKEAWSEYGEAFVGGAALGGTFGIPKLRQANQQGRDINTGLTANEQTVLDKVAEKQIAEAEKDGKKLTNKEKNKIIKEVQEDLQKGLIDTADIESVLGGESYTRLQDTNTRVENLKKEIAEIENKPNTEATVKDIRRLNSLEQRLKEIDTTELQNNLQTEVFNKIGKDNYLQRSYYEKAQRGVRFTQEISEDASEIRKAAYTTASEVMHNTTRSHQLVETAVKIGEATNTKFIFVNNEKLKRYYKDLKEGTSINGLVNKKGEVLINVQGNNIFEKIVGHETTHLLEGTKEYKLLQEAVKEYATIKGEYDTKLQSLTKLYEGTDANVENEITSDLVGDYIFTDTEFVNHLSAKQPNVFKKIYDYIKHLAKQVTAGSKEARQLEKVRYRFEQAYRNVQKTGQNGQITGQKTVQISKETQNEIIRKTKEAIKDKYKDNKIEYMSVEDIAKLETTGKGNRPSITEQVRENGITDPLEITINDKGVPVLEDGNHRLEAAIELGLKEVPVRIREANAEQTEMVYKHLHELNTGYFDRVKYSLSDNQGRKLTKEQQEYFKDSKVRDKEGRLLEVYHGTQTKGINIFQYDPKRQTGTDYGEAYYFTSDYTKAEGYGYDITKDPRFIESEKESEAARKRMVAEDFSEESRKHFAEVNKKYNIFEIMNDEEYIHNNYDIVGGEVKKLYLNLANPLIVDAEGQYYFKVYDKYFKQARENGNDGIIVKNVIDVANGEHRPTDVYIAFNNNQFKNVDNTKPTSNPDIRYSLSEDTDIDTKINSSMTMAEAEDMIQRAFIIAKANEDYSTAKEWVEADPDDVAMWIENDYNLQSKYINSNEDILDEEYTINDVIEAYINGTLVGKEKVPTKRLDLTKDTGYKDSRFYAPQDIKGGQDLYEIANQRVTNANREQVYKARADFIINAHNKGYIESLGLSKDEVSKKLKSWANYTKRAMDLSNSFNEGVAPQNRWTGIENSSIVNTISISNEEMGKLVKEIKGDSSGWQRQYITSTMLALDTHIDYSKLTFDFEPGQEMSQTAAGDYSAATDTIRIKRAGQNTVAHEIGHYIDHLWARELGLGQYSSLTDRNTNFNNLSDEQAQFVKNFHNFLADIESTSDIGSAYKMSSNEVLARFIGKFTEWVKNQATNNRYGYEDKWYKDNFTESQFREFVKILQEKSALDTTATQYSLSDPNATAPRQRGLTYSEDVMFNEEETIAPLQQEINNLSNKITELMGKITVNEDDYAPIGENELSQFEQQNSQNFQTLDDDIAPVEAEEDFVDEKTPTASKSLFDTRDYEEVGNRKVKAYQYEHPEVRPYFQKAAKEMLMDLNDTIKGERSFNSQLYYDSNGEDGFYGTTRHTAKDIAELLDGIDGRYKLSYAEIRKGLEAIIEDHGAENNAASKRIEFYLDQRLRNGYVDTMGYDIPADKGYLDLMESKEYHSYFDNIPIDESLIPEDTTPTETKVTSNNIVEPFEGVATQRELDLESGDIIDETVSELEKKKARERKKLGNKENYIKNKVTELYDEAKALKKGVRASYDLSRLLDFAFQDIDTITKDMTPEDAKAERDRIWRDITNSFMNIKVKPFETVNPNSKIEARIRQYVGRQYDAKLDEINNLKDEDLKKITRADIKQGYINRVIAKFKEHGYDFEKILDNAKNKSTFSSVDNTPQRFVEKSLGYKEGQIFNDLTSNQTALNESEAIKWLNSFTNRKDGELAKISKEYNIKPFSKEDKAAQMYGEGFFVDDNNQIIKYGDGELAQDFPDATVRENIKKLAKDPRIRQIYDDTLDRINESRKRNGYPEIPRRNDYFLHFRAMEDTFSRMGLPFNPNDIRAKDLPTDLNGVTADLKPGQPYFASAKQRKGLKTSYSLLGGIERYLSSAKNQIYHIDDIQMLRSLRDYVADRFGQAKGLENLDELTEEEIEQRIKEVFDAHLSNFAKFLNEQANVLAGKTTLIDRGLEGIIGRRGLTTLDTINSQVGKNLIAYSIASPFTNLVAGVQAFAKGNKFDSLKAFTQVASNKIKSIFGKSDGFMEKDLLAIRRQGADNFYRTPYQKISDYGYVLMGAIDNVTTEFTVRTKYNELTRKGMSHEKAMIEADKWAARILGDRSLGQQPQLYNSKLLGLITKFQLEVRNQLDSMIYDTIKEAEVDTEGIQDKLKRNRTKAAKITSTMVQLAVFQHLFGKAFESVIGYNPAFDIISVLMTAFGFDDEEESEDTVLDNLDQAFQELLGDLPYTSTLTGGRIPIEAALPIEELVTGKDAYGNEKSRLKTIGETLPYYVMPGGYNQIKKTVQGLGMFDDDLPVSGSYTASGNLRYPVEDTIQNRIQAGIFGQYANENARDYFDNERLPLKEKQIQEYIDLDMPIKDYWKYRDGLKGLDKLEDKIEYVNKQNVTTEQKNIMVNNLTDRKEKIDMSNYNDFGSLEEFDFANGKDTKEKYEFLQANNISYKEYNASEESRKAYNWAYENPESYIVSKAVTDDLVTYRKYKQDLAKFKDIKDENGKVLVKAQTQKENYINNLNISYEAKIILYKSEYSSAKEYDEDIINYLNSRDDLSYEEKITIVNKLDK